MPPIHWKPFGMLVLCLATLVCGCTRDDQPETTNRRYYAEAPEHAQPSSGLSLLEVSSFQQTTEYTCGPASVLSMLGYFGRTGYEMTIATEMGTSTSCGTTPGQMTDWLNAHGFVASWHEYGELDTLRNRLGRGLPTLVEWSDWGGHWVLVVGYDTRNTEGISDDVIIFADPYDRHDDNPEGLTWFNAERFYYMWYDALLFGQVMRRIYIAAEPV